MATLLKIEKQTNNKFLNMYKGTFYNENTNKNFDYFIASRKDENNLSCITKDHKKCDAVMIIPRFSNGDIVMIKQYRAPINDYIYEFPSGLVDKGESIEEAVKRELKEETGLDVITQKTLVKTSYTSAGMSDESLAIQEVLVCGEIDLKYKEENEDIEVIILKKQDIDNFIKEHNIAIKAALYLTLQK